MSAQQCVDRQKEGRKHTLTNNAIAEKQLEQTGRNLNPCSEELDDEIQLGELQRSTPNSDREEKEATGNCHNTLFTCKPMYFKYFMLP